MNWSDKECELTEEMHSEKPTRPRIIISSEWAIEGKYAYLDWRDSIGLPADGVNVIKARRELDELKRKLKELNEAWERGELSLSDKESFPEK